MNRRLLRLIARAYAWAYQRLYHELAWSYDIISWLVSFIGRGRPERTITAQQVIGRRAIERLTEIEAGEQDPAASPRRAG